MLQLIQSKKFLTAVVSAIVPFVCYFLDIPPEVAITAVGGLVSAIVGFSVQDFAKARDSLSTAQLDQVGTAIVSKLRESGKIDPEVTSLIQEVIDRLRTPSK